MIEGLQETDLSGALEALMFVTDEPVSVLTLADMLEVDAKSVESALSDLQSDLIAADRGIQLQEVAGGWRLATHPRYLELIERYVLSWDTRKLSAAALETLAIVAYTQPVTRAQISSIRGVSSDSSINSLIEKGLVREAGVADAPGNPTLYATTKTFLEKFGLNSVKDLTDIAEFAPDEETRRLIAQRLSSTKETVIVSDAEARMMAEEIKNADADADTSTYGSVSDEEKSFELDDAESGTKMSESNIAQSENSDELSEMFREAIASTLGVVDKIDFDELDFDMSDE